MPSLYLIHQILNVTLLLLSLGLLYTVLNGAPYLPTDTKSVDEMVALAHVTSQTKMVDIGSGDGKIILAFAKAGAEAHGYEINPVLVWITKYRIKRAGLSARCFVHQGSFWNVDFSPYNTITLFGITRIMKKLEEKLQKELKPGTKIFSHVFKFPTMKCIEERPLVRVYEV